MSQHSAIWILALVLIRSGLVLNAAGVSQAIPTGSATNRFVENKGQWEEIIRFRTEIPGGYVFFYDNGYSILFYDDPRSGQHHSDIGRHGFKGHHRPAQLRETSFHLVDFHFVKSATRPRLSGELAGTEKYNYFLGNDPLGWVSGANTYRELRYQELPSVLFKNFLNCRQVSQTKKIEMDQEGV